MSPCRTRTSLSPVNALEIVNTFENVERWQVGTITARELAETIFFKGFSPVGYTPQDLERDALHILGADSSKELETKDVTAIFSFVISKGLAALQPVLQLIPEDEFCP